MLLDPMTGWLVGALADAGVRLIEGSGRERLLRLALSTAVEEVVARTDPASRQALRDGLSLCFTRPPAVPVNGAVSVAAGLRTAVAAQIELLEQMANSSSGAPFFTDTGIDRAWLENEVSEAFVSALHQVVAASGPTELVHSLRFEQLAGSIAELQQQVTRSVAPGLSAPISTLPPAISGFTGRDAELARLLTTLRRTAETATSIGIHAIAGMAGIGKTAFAIHVAHQLAERFPDGRLWVALHGHTPGRSPVTPLEALGRLLITSGMAAQEIPDGLDERSSLWRQRLAGKKVLLVLDDATGSDQVRPLLPAGEGCLVLITSRRALTGLDEAVPVFLDVLPTADAVAMFIRQSFRSDLLPDDHGVARLVDLCGHLPLAISVMAGRLRHKDPALWNAARLADELEAARDRLGDLRSENRSVTAAFDLSYRGLTSLQQSVFRAIGLHPGADIDPYAAGALTDLPPDLCRRGLDGLCEHHLARETATPGRYTLHDLIRQHARSLAASVPATERQAALDRILDYYECNAAHAGAHFSGRLLAPPVHASLTAIPKVATLMGALSWLEAERANLIAIVEHAADRDEGSRQAATIPAALAQYLFEHGDKRETMALHELACTAARRLGDRELEARALSDLGRRQRLTPSNPLYQALDLFRSLGDRRGEASVLKRLGDGQRLRGDFRDASVSLTEALRLYQDLDDRLGQAHALSDLGTLHREAGRMRAAADAQTTALQLYRELRYPLGEARALARLGLGQYLTGEYEPATRSLDQGLQLYRRLRSKRGQAHVLNYLGMLQHSTGQYDTAAVTLREALTLYQQQGTRSGEASVLNDLGILERLQGDHEAAEECLKRALRLFRAERDRRGEADALNSLGDLGREYATETAPGLSYAEALAIARDVPVPREEARALEGLGRLCLQMGTLGEAGDHLTQALAIYRRISSPNAGRVHQDLLRLWQQTSSGPENEP